MGSAAPHHSHLVLITHAVGTEYFAAYSDTSHLSHRTLLTLQIVAPVCLGYSCILHGPLGTLLCNLGSSGPSPTFAIAFYDHIIFNINHYFLLCNFARFNILLHSKLSAFIKINVKVLSKLVLKVQLLHSFSCIIS